VYVDPISSSDDCGAVFVREGFCWPAALFSVIWTLWHRLWAWSLVLVVVGAGFGVAASWWGIGPMIQAVVTVGIAILVGFHANDWRRGSLVRRGYLLAGVVAGDGIAAAEQRFFDRVSLSRS
jgi:hypothetical protein